MESNMIMTLHSEMKLHVNNITFKNKIARGKDDWEKISKEKEDNKEHNDTLYNNEECFNYSGSMARILIVAPSTSMTTKHHNNLRLKVEGDELKDNRSKRQNIIIIERKHQQS